MNEEQTRFAAEPNIAVFASVDRKGRPHATPVWYLFDGGEFRISVGNGSQKHGNIEANPEVTLVIDKRDLPPYALMISGRAEVGPTLSDDERLQLATRYLGEQIGRSYVGSTAGEDTVTIHLKPRKVMEFDPTMRL
ncbi:MAG: pyridoxamine 5'-phosphate oxidase family protein [Dehalococcoidia bacterium]